MPVDYGLVGMASIYLGVITLISEFGVGSAVITLRDLSEEQWRSSTVSRCCSGCQLRRLLRRSDPLGRFFQAPELPGLVVTLSAGFVITAFKTVPFFAIATR